jgi:hypothetical protein
MINYKALILSKDIIIKYCQKFKIRYEARGKVFVTLCPFCNQFTAQNVASTHLLKCLNTECSYKGEKYTLVKIIRKTEPDKTNWTTEQIINYIKKLFKVNNVITDEDRKQIEKWFEIYQKNNFSLVPIRPNDKIPIEIEWQQKLHTDSKEWLEWISNFLNIGVNCKLSKLTIIDIDQKPIPEEIKKMMGETLIAESSKGFHLYYQEEIDLPKTRIDSLKIDIETGNGQVVIFPSVIKGIQRKWINNNPIIKIPQELKEFLQKNITVKDLKTNSEKTKETTINETYKKILMEEGSGRHDYIFHLGCILRKQLNLTDTEFVLGVINKISCSPSLPYTEMRNIINSITDYSIYDQKELVNQILEYLKEVNEATHRDIERIIFGDNRLVKDEKQRLDKVIAYLIREKYISKKRNIYTPIKKIEWETSLMEAFKPVNFKIPYFNDIAYFKWGNLILISSKQKIGKTHISINIIKKLIEQGITPYYLSLEPDNLFMEIAIKMGLKEGDFKYKFCIDPTQVELESNAITIVDWLMIENKAETDLIFKKLIEQLQKTKGILIVFQQLKEDNTYFAPNLVNQFPAFSARYIYDDENDGTKGKFFVDVIRRPIRKIKKGIIPCIYNYETLELKRIDEMKEEDVNKLSLEEQQISDGKEEDEKI